MRFWNIDEFKLNDDLNVKIWKESAAKGRTLQGDSTCEFGAQQAMLTRIPDFIGLDENSSLPWVPDLVGINWKDADALVVVGSAYAGFIRQYSSRKATMCLRDYASATSASEFQRRFLSNVVQGDGDYYEKIARLVSSDVAASHLVIFDLCRASFVRRVNRIASREDESGDAVVRAAPDLFEKYVQANSSWTWERILGTNARIIVALGTIAEHGLLRLFAKNLANFEVRVAGTESTLNLAKMKSDSSSGWVTKYAKFQLCFWTGKQTWWHITGNVNGNNRDWKLLPVYHPAARPPHYDPGYEGAINVLAKARKAKG